jgi:hypothetical protein
LREASRAAALVPLKERWAMMASFRSSISLAPIVMPGRRERPMRRA